MVTSSKRKQQGLSPPNIFSELGPWNIVCCFSHQAQSTGYKPCSTGV